MASRSSESRTEAVARELLKIRGWSTSHPPKGHVLWKNEYRDYPQLLSALTGRGKTGRGGDGYPDFLVVSKDAEPLIVGETKARDDDIETATQEGVDYAQALCDHGYNVLAAGVAGSDEGDIAVRVKKRGRRGWQSIEYRKEPIQWLPTPEETQILLRDEQLFELFPQVPAPEILASRGEEINRILRECKIKDEFRPAVIGAFMLALVHSKGNISRHPENVLGDINRECKKAFQKAGKYEIADSILVPEANEKLATRAPQITHILNLLNVTTLTAAHDYIGQLYETFFRFTGGNTIGQFFTPRHITKFVVDICEVSSKDSVIDPTCGTGGFLVSSLYKMMGGKHLTKDQISDLVKDHLQGFESEPITAALCVANMILRGDGTTGIVKGDCFTSDKYPENEASVAVGNPPFPHKKTDDPTEKFVDRALEALRVRGELAMIVPASLLVKSNKKSWRKSTLAKHSLRGVITLPGELFQPYAAATTAILILEKGVPHNVHRPVFFCRIENDGFRLKKNVRIQQPGEQLTEALHSYQGNLSKPGFCAWAPFSGDDWSPGAFIESEPYGEYELQQEIEKLFRGEAAFHCLYADHLAAYRASLENGLKQTAYSSLTKRKPWRNDERPGRIGKFFDIYYGQKELHNKENLVSGLSLVVSSTGTNNGCYGFFDFSKIIKPPFATVPSTGSIGEAFVQNWPCGVTDDCLILIPRENTPVELLYVAAAIARRESWRFNYGRKITPRRVAEFVVPYSDSLVQWIARRKTDLAVLNADIFKKFTNSDINSKFAELALRWKKERGPSSSATKMAKHPAYRDIVRMGEQVVPLILNELVFDPDHWFLALHEITRADPIPIKSHGKIKDMATAWIQWGRERGMVKNES